MRAEGFHWVKYTNEWIIAHWQDNSWWLCDYELKDSDLDEIDERRIERTDKDVIELVRGNPDPAPKYISDNPYLCNE